MKSNNCNLYIPHNKVTRRKKNKKTFSKSNIYLFVT